MGDEYKVIVETGGERIECIVTAGNEDDAIEEFIDIVRRKAKAFPLDESPDNDGD